MAGARSAIYRVRQFVRAAGAWIRPGDGGLDRALTCLSPAAARLFRAMPHYDRQHGFRVWRALGAQGYIDPDLLAAALLHDAGKTVGEQGALQLWHRVAAVLMRAFVPGLAERVGRDRARGWRRGFYLQIHHAAIGAELARQAGCSPRTVDLIRHHEDPPGQVEDPLLAALQAADSQN